MRRQILHPGAVELRYEIREIVKSAMEFQKRGVSICWENIGDPIQKGTELPPWMKEIVAKYAMQDSSYAYSPTKGILATREYLAKRTNDLAGVQIDAEDILFCNGLGDGISKVYERLSPSARVIGPSPAYSTHSSAEANHASDSPLTYTLDPENQWLPDMQDLEHKIQYNPNIVGILIINPDNPTGMVYPKEILKQIVDIARKYQLFIVADEIYTNITYNGVKAVQLAEVIDDVCGISMKGISKEFPWPGSRCGWMEFYNTDSNPQFKELISAIEHSKMLEVCSTTLPQLTIPEIMEHQDYWPNRKKLNEEIEARGDLVYETLKNVHELTVNKTYGAFYNTIVFKPGVLNNKQSLKLDNPEIEAVLSQMILGAELDKRFVYYLLAKTGICVVPISSFCSELLGFRVTLLEGDPKKMKWIYEKLKTAIQEYVASA